MIWDFPGGTVDKNPPANAGDMGLIPVPGRFHMPWGNQAWVPQLLRPEGLEHMLYKKRSHYNEKHMHLN